MRHSAEWKEKEEDCTQSEILRDDTNTVVATLPFEWWQPIETLELNDVTRASSRALRLRGASPVPGFA
jgi:hypothetical protein